MFRPNPYNAASTSGVTDTTTLGIDHAGALVKITADVAGTTTGANVVWTALVYDTTFDPRDGGAVQRFWLGANFTFATSDVDTTLNTITESAHGFTTGEGPVWFTTSGGLPAGTTAATNYWIIVVDANTIKLATTRANALAGVAVDITSQGTGTHTCNRGEYLVVPAGVSKVRVSGNLETNTDLAGFINVRIRKNGAFVVGLPHQVTQSAGDGGGTNIVSTVLSVSEGDVFSFVENGEDAYSLNGDVEACWFSIEVVKRSA